MLPLDFREVPVRGVLFCEAEAEGLPTKVLRMLRDRLTRLRDKLRAGGSGAGPPRVKLLRNSSIF